MEGLLEEVDTKVFQMTQVGNGADFAERLPTDRRLAQKKMIDRIVSPFKNPKSDRKDDDVVNFKEFLREEVRDIRDLQRFLS